LCVAEGWLRLDATAARHESRLNPLVGSNQGRGCEIYHSAAVGAKRQDRDEGRNPCGEKSTEDQSLE
jgi:hypothetical protein